MPGLILLLACGAGEPDAARFARAIAPEAPEPLATCRGIGAPEIRDECLATVLRGQPELPGEACEEVGDPRWRGECWFTVAERYSADPDRQAALLACGRAGPFYDECLYHRWTAELGLVVAAAPDLPAALELALEPLTFWGALQTLGGDPRAQVEGDLWFLWLNAHRPISLGDCIGMGEDSPRCVEGTRTFIRRALLGELLSPGRPADLLDRVCRSGEIPEIFVEGLYDPDPVLDAERDAVIPLACAAAEGQPVRRWNPVFRGSRQG